MSLPPPCGSAGLAARPARAQRSPRAYGAVPRGNSWQPIAPAVGRWLNGRRAAAFALLAAVIMVTCPLTEARFTQIVGEVRARSAARPCGRVDRAGVCCTQWLLHAMVARPVREHVNSELR